MSHYSVPTLLSCQGVTGSDVKIVTQAGFGLCNDLGNTLTVLFSLHQLYKMQRISSFPEESDRLRCFVLVTTPLFTRLRFLQTIRTFAKFKSFLCLPECWMRSEKSAKHGYFESESFNDVLSPLPSVRLMREEIKLEFSAYFWLSALYHPWATLLKDDCPQ